MRSAFFGVWLTLQVRLTVRTSDDGLNRRIILFTYVNEQNERIGVA